jgi:AcrR family transcriptional regulator
VPSAGQNVYDRGKMQAMLIGEDTCFEKYYCMQVLKEDIRNNILQASRAEFLERGFKGTSMRRIAQTSGVPLSSIYSYYRSKDEILNVILAPMIEQLEIFIRGKAMNIADDTETRKWQEWAIKSLVNLTQNFGDELYLLLFRSQGSTAEHFLSRHYDEQTKHTVAVMKQMGKIPPELNTNLLPFFLRSIGEQQISLIGEIVSKELTIKQKFFCKLTKGFFLHGITLRYISFPFPTLPRFP